MSWRFLFIALLYSCSSQPPRPIVMPPTKKANNSTKQETIYKLGYMSDYDIWEFLKGSPAQKDVIETFGLPDSVWLDENRTTKYLYYYILQLRDYNTIEISTKTDTVSGFEWD